MPTQFWREDTWRLKKTHQHLHKLGTEEYRFEVTNTNIEAMVKRDTLTTRTQDNSP
jgi:hypothetical protein